MIEKVANNKSVKEALNLNSPRAVLQKLDYYRSLFGRTHDMSDKEFDALTKNITTFFNLKPFAPAKEPPAHLVRISNNNRILQGQELSYLTDISQLLAPPAHLCNFGRCNVPGKRVLYCATTPALAYWETKPRNGDVITLSYFERKPSAHINCAVISAEKTANPSINHALQEVYYLLEEFFVDAFSLEVDRTRPRDYVFSALLSSEFLFYPVPSDKNIEAIIYPSVQKKKFGDNFAIRADLILKHYNLIGVETRFILDEYENIDPSTEELTTDSLIGSFGTRAFDFDSGKILYDEKATEIFELFRRLQIGSGKQVRYSKTLPDGGTNMAFDLSPKLPPRPVSAPIEQQKFGRNDRVTVVYKDGTRKERIKHKYVARDIEKGLCKITETHR